MEILGLFKIFMKSCPRGTVPTWARFPAPGTRDRIFFPRVGDREFIPKNTEPNQSNPVTENTGPSQSNPVTEMLRDRVTRIPLPRIRDRVNQIPLPRIRDRVTRVPLPRCCGTESLESRYRDVAGPSHSSPVTEMLRDRIYSRDYGTEDAIPSQRGRICTP